MVGKRMRKTGTSLDGIPVQGTGVGMSSVHALATQFQRFPGNKADAMTSEVNPDHISPVQWSQAMGLARQVCARIFRDGGTPTDAVVAFGMDQPGSMLGWDQAVERLALEICREPVRRAA
jgi:hypothetical protein